MRDSVKQFYERLPEDMDPYLKQQWGRYFLKRDASLCGIGVLLIMVVQLIGSPVLEGVIALLKRGGAYTPVIDELLNAIFYIVYMGIPFLIVAMASGRKAEQLVVAQRPRRGTFLPALLIGLGTMPLLQYASSAIDWVLSQIAMDTYEPLLEQAFAPVDDPAAVAVQFLVTGVLAAFFEEFAFRGVVLQLLRRYGDTLAIFGSAFLFGLMHGNTYQMPFAFMLGVVIGAAVVWTGSIWTGVALHASNNFIAFAISAITDGMDEKMTNLLSLAVWSVVLVLGIVGVIVYLLRKSKGSLPPFGAAAPEIAVDRPAAVFFSSPWVITAIVVLGISAFLITTLVQSIRL